MDPSPPNTRGAPPYGPGYPRSVPPYTQGALDAGFAFAILEWPNWDGSDVPGYPTSTVSIAQGFDAPQLCDVIAGKAAKLFGPAETTSLSMLCKLEKIDCSKGVGVAGYSQGSEIGSMAAMLDSRVKAYFGIALKTVLGPSFEATCLRDATLPASARRYLNGGDDLGYPQAWAGGQAVEKYQLKAMSGYDCGEELDCLQSDGSGYFIVPRVNHEDIYAGNHIYATQAMGPNRLQVENMAAYGPMMNGFEWLMGRTLADTPGCPCPEGSRRKLLFGSMPDASTCCASF